MTVRRRLAAMSILALYASAATASETITYTYDSRGRLVQILHSGTVNNWVTSSYSYDRADNRANVTVSNTGSSPATLSISDASVTEGGTLTFTVTRGGSTASALTVNYATANGTAVAGADYTAASGTLSFAASETTKTISVPTTDDTSAEPAETLFVNLSGATPGTILSDMQGVGTINDNDLPSFSVSDAAGSEGDTLVFTITKTGYTSSTLSVSYATANGTAVGGSDYAAVSGTLTFGPTETTKTVYVDAFGDTITEPTETFYLNLSAPSAGSMLSDGQGVGSISDSSDPPPDPICYDGSGQRIVCP